MSHAMAGWTKRREISRGVDDVTRTELRNRSEMMDLDEPGGSLTITDAEVHTAGFTCETVNGDCCRTVAAIPLVLVNLDCLPSPLREPAFCFFSEP